MWFFVSLSVLLKRRFPDASAAHVPGEEGVCDFPYFEFPSRAVGKPECLKKECLLISNLIQWPCFIRMETPMGALEHRQAC